jgi:putative ABC transport system substrate-binding protein
MNRREFILLVGGTTLWVSSVRAQEPPRIIGFLNGFGPGHFSDVATGAFIQGLKDEGFVEGRNLIIEFRHAEGHYDRLPSLAAELVDQNVTVIFAGDVPSAFAAKAATKRFR